jgi:excisionase family DNA binding protein
MEGVLLISEAAELLSIPIRTIQRWCIQKRIGVGKRAGKRRIYTLSEADLVTLKTLAEERAVKRDRSGRFR